MQWYPVPQTDSQRRHFIFAATFDIALCFGKSNFHWTSDDPSDKKIFTGRTGIVYMHDYFDQCCSFLIVFYKIVCGLNKSLLESAFRYYFTKRKLRLEEGLLFRHFLARGAPFPINI